MEIKKIIFDFDEVLVDTINAVIAVYDHDFGSHKKYVKPNIENLYRWDMLDMLTLADMNWIIDVFSKQLFFDNLKLKIGARQLLNDLMIKGYEIIICTKGTNLNISLKSKFIDDNFVGIETIYMNISKGKSDTGKQLIDMSGSIFIDDNQHNLFSSNANHKILFSSYGDDKEWNDDWGGVSVSNMSELRRRIYDILEPKK